MSHMPRVSARFSVAAAAALLSLLAGRNVESAKPKSTEVPPPNVQFESDGKTLKGWLFKPEGKDLKGPFPAVIWNHGSDGTVRPSLPLAKTYNDKGFVVFYPVRRYHHPSTQGKTIMELIKAEPPNGQAWIHYQEEEVSDVFNALAWLKKQPYVDPDRIVVSGVSFGGVQTLLVAEKGGGFKAAICFGGGAMSWGGGHSIIDTRLEQAVKNRKLPLFILQAKNDFSLGPSNVLGPLLDDVKLLHKVKQYPEFGTRTPGMSDDAWHHMGHGGFATEGGEVWGADVFSFIKEAMGPAGDTHVVHVDPHGRPAGEHAGTGARYQLWLDAEGCHVRTFGSPAHETHFRGSIAVKGGSLGSVHGVLSESKGKGADHWITHSDQKSIAFDFATRSEDGISFVVHGKDAQLTFELEIGEGAPKFEADRVYIGKGGDHPKSNPFELGAN